MADTDVTPQQLHPRSWVSKVDLCDELLCSPRTVEEYVSRAVFVPGEDFYRVGMKRGPLVFNVDSCRRRLLAYTALAAKAEAAEQSNAYDEQHLDELLKQVRKGNGSQ